MVKRSSDISSDKRAGAIKSDVSSIGSGELPRKARPKIAASHKSPVCQTQGTSVRFCKKVKKLCVNSPIEMTNRFLPLTSVPEVDSKHSVHTVIDKGEKIHKRVYPYGKSRKANVSPTKKLENKKRTNDVHNNSEFQRSALLPSRLSHYSCVTNMSNVRDETMRCPNIANRNVSVTSLQGSRASDTSKYDLGLTSLASKCEKIKKAKMAKFNHLFRSQNKDMVGFIPLSKLPPRLLDNSCPTSLTYLEIQKMFREDGRPNFCGLQIPISSSLNHERFFHHLRDYWDWQIPFFVKFGFPLDIKKDCEIKNEEINHPSALNFPTHVDHYLSEEKSHGAILGPLDTPPPDFHVSPFLSREKSDSDRRRVIIDLSWPKFGSVNENVKENEYLGVEYMLTLPNWTMSSGHSFIAKIDVSRAFKHLPIDPGDIDRLGVFWKQYFIEKNLVFGYKLGCKFYQRLADSIQYIMAKEKQYILNYLDDSLIFGNCENGL